MTIRSVLSTTSDIPGSSAGLVDRNATEKDILILRGLEAGPGIQIDVVDFDLGVYTTPQKKIVIQAKGAGGGAIGEINRATNLGSGVGLFADKSGDALRFKSLVAGSGIRLTPAGQEITVESEGVIGAANLGSGSKLYDDTQAGTTLQFRTLIPGANIELAQVGNTIQIATTAQNNEGANLGGVGTTALYAGMDGSRLTFRALRPGNNVELVQSSGEIMIHATDTGEVNTASNRAEDDPANFGVFAGKINVDLQFRSLRAGSNVTLSSTDTAITIDAKGDLTDGVSRGTAGIGTAEIIGGKAGTLLEFRRLAAGTPNVTLQQTTDQVVISVAESGEINTGDNLGTDGEAVFANKTGQVLNFKRIKSGDNVQITSDSNSITISATDTQGLRNVVDDLTPRLGGDLDVQDHAITSTANRDIVISANGSGQVVLNGGQVVLDGLRWPNVDGSDGQVLTTNGAGSLSWTTVSSGGPGEATTASNVGTAGVDVFGGMTDTNLAFKRLHGPGVVTVTDNTGENRIDLEVDIDALEDALTLGDISGVLPLEKGGTGGTTQTTARSSLGLGTMATENAGSVTITGGSINGTTIGATTPAGASFTNLTANGTITFNGSQWPINAGTNGQVLTADGTGGLIWSTPAGGGSGGGEANDGANTGTGSVNFYKGKTGTTLQFRSLNTGSDKLLLDFYGETEAAATTVRIDVAEDKLNIANMTGTLPVIRGGTGRSTALTANAVLIGGSSGIEQTPVPTLTNTVLTWTGSTFAWTSVSGGGSTASNVGTAGVGVYKDAASSVLEFKKLNAVSDRLTITDDTDNNKIDLDIAQDKLSLNSIGGTLGVAKGGTGAATFPTNGLLVGNGTGTFTSVVVPTVTNTILRWNGSTFEWGAIAPGGDVTGATNLGSGQGLYTSKLTGNLQFKSLTAGTAITLTPNTNDVSIAVNEGGLTLGNLGGTLPVGKGGTGLTTIADKAILVGGTSGLATIPAPTADTYLRYNGTSFTWTAVAGGGDVTGATNLGSGQGLYTSKATGSLQFKSLTAGSTKIGLTGNADNIAIDVNQANLALNSIGGTLGVDKGGTGAITLASKGLLMGNGTAAVSTIAVPDTADTYLKYDGSTFVWSPVTAGGGGSGAPTDASYLVLSGGASTSSLSNERTLAGSATIRLTDGGANGNATLEVIESGLTLGNLGGTLPVGKGGTGASTFTTNGVLVGNGTSAVTALTPPAGASPTEPQALAYNGTTLGWVPLPGELAGGGGGGFTSVFQIVMTMSSSGITNIVSKPAGWEVSATGNKLTVSSHNATFEPKFVTFRGQQSATAVRIIPQNAGTIFIDLVVGSETTAFSISGLVAGSTGAASGLQTTAFIYF